MASNNTSNINSIYFNQLSQLPHQISKCPTSIQKIDVVDHKTGLAPNEYLSAEWNALEKHYMMNVPLRIKETEVKTVTISDGGSKMVTNIIATNDGLFDVHIRGWEPHAKKLFELQPGAIYLFSNLYIREPGAFVYGNAGYLLGFNNGSSVRMIIRPNSSTKNQKKNTPS